MVSAGFPHVVEVVVLPAGADALLGVVSARDSPSRRSDRHFIPALVKRRVESSYRRHGEERQLLREEAVCRTLL